MKLLRWVLPLFLLSAAHAADSTVTVLVAYTKGAANSVGGVGMLKAMADTGFANLNRALSDSRTNVRAVPSAKWVEVSGVGARSDVGALLGQLTNPAGPFKGVHKARAQQKADVVLLVFSGSNTAMGNLGKPPASAMGKRAFMVAGPGTFFGSQVFAHEFAHVLGCSHQNEQNGMAPYARGYGPIAVPGAQNSKRKTITASLPGAPTVGYFSANRTVSHRFQKRDASFGTTTIRIGDASHDCARNIREVGAAYAKLGDSLSAPSGGGGHATRLVRPTPQRARVKVGKHYTHKDGTCVKVEKIVGLNQPGYIVKWSRARTSTTHPGDPESNLGAECTPDDLKVGEWRFVSYRNTGCVRVESVTASGATWSKGNSKATSPWPKGNFGDKCTPPGGATAAAPTPPAAPARPSAPAAGNVQVGRWYTLRVGGEPGRCVRITKSTPAFVKYEQGDVKGSVGRDGGSPFNHGAVFFGTCTPLAAAVEKAPAKVGQKAPAKAAMTPKSDPRGRVRKSVACARQKFSLGRDGRVWLKEGKGWTHAGDRCKNVTCRKKRLICTSQDGSAWTYQGAPLKWSKAEDSQGEIAKRLKCANKRYKLGKDGRVWAKNKGAWVHAGDRCQRVSCQKKKVVCTSKDGSRWAYQGQPHKWAPAK